MEVEASERRSESLAYVARAYLDAFEKAMEGRGGRCGLVVGRDNNAHAVYCRQLHSHDGPCDFHTQPK